MNENHVSITIHYVRELLLTGAFPSIVIIALYLKQVILYRNALVALKDQDTSSATVDISTVIVASFDAIQGREGDYVFVDLIIGEKTGFLDVDQRVIVGLTRAKAGMMVVGNTSAIEGNPRFKRFLLNDVVSHCKQGKLRVEVD